MDRPGSLLPLLSLQLVHLDEERVWRVVDVRPVSVAKRPLPLTPLAHHLYVLPADLQHVPLVVAVLGNGEAFGLLKSVSLDLLQIRLLKIAGFICQRLDFLRLLSFSLLVGGVLLNLANFLLMMRCSTMSFLFMMLLLLNVFVIVNDLSDTELDSRWLFDIFLALIISNEGLFLLRVLYRFVFSAQFPW